MIRTLTILALLSTPVMADELLKCEDGSWLTMKSGARGDMIIHRDGDMDISIPFRVETGNGVMWTPHTTLKSEWCDDATAPCAMEKQGDGGPYHWYMLQPGVTVNCDTK